MPLKIVQSDHGGRRVLAIEGDLDLVTAPMLSGAGTGLVDAGETDVVIDASALEFCDSSGLTAFIMIANRLRPHGRLAISSPQPIVRRVLEVSGLVEVFVIAESVPDAVAILDADRPTASES
jgi:anti-sigma B factor antagonist